MWRQDSKTAAAFAADGPAGQGRPSEQGAHDVPCIQLRVPIYVGHIDMHFVGSAEETSGKRSVSEGTEIPGRIPVAALLEKDAFLVFRALCKLSVRTSEAAGVNDATTSRGKVSITLCPGSNLRIVLLGN